MMPTIRIDDEVMGELKRHAEPFEDTPNSVLRQLLGLDASRSSGRTTTRTTTPEVAPSSPATSHPTSSPTRRTRSRDYERTPQNAFARPLLEKLVHIGGGGQCDDVLNQLEHELMETLKPTDTEVLASGEVRWRKDVQWVRLKLRDKGYISDARRGWWQITDAGRQALEGGEPLL